MPVCVSTSYVCDECIHTFVYAYILVFERVKFYYNFSTCYVILAFFCLWWKQIYRIQWKGFFSLSLFSIKFIQCQRPILMMWRPGITFILRATLVSSSPTPRKVAKEKGSRFSWAHTKFEAPVVIPPPDKRGPGQHHTHYSRAISTKKSLIGARS